MRLQVPCLDDFESIATPQKRELIRHICLNFESPRYTPTCCSRSFSPPITTGSIVGDGIWKLMSILSTWGPSSELALEINVYSPSDCEHYFKNIYLSSDDVEHDEDPLTDACRAGSQYHDPRHGWKHGRQTTAPPPYALDHLFEDIRLSFPDTLPRVQAVTHLIIRRQLRRRLTWELRELLRAFGRLEQMSFEPWAPYQDAYKTYHKLTLAFLIQSYLPNTLNRLIAFEDSYEFYDKFLKPPVLIPWYSSAHNNDGVGVALAYRSVRLEHLAVSFMVDAEQVFRHCQAKWIWPKLQSLALTSQLLQDGREKREQIEALLFQASVLARRMPRMHTFVLWNGGKGHACAFIYRNDGDTASITWRGTWRLELNSREVESWQLTASKPRFLELELKQEHIREIIRSHGDAIYHLKLPCQVIDPASLWQIRREAYTKAQ
ncbi:hypothetical protein NM208_g2867 [Fusarium decemcellulare]|uniref:Uncharacterized protein n=1 Tax=Fusarium decemcellulare TaxID=57161 RepID=A0ACC1SR54_9HYPO|nr:hypothetical protein NM208_g2867 [Fusarium decemcellulare]